MDIDYCPKCRSLNTSRDLSTNDVTCLSCGFSDKRVVSSFEDYIDNRSKNNNQNTTKVDVSFISQVNRRNTSSTGLLGITD